MRPCLRVDFSIGNQEQKSVSDSTEIEGIKLVD